MRHRTAESAPELAKTEIGSDLDLPPPRRLAAWLLARRARLGDRMTDYTHQAFVPATAIKSEADIKRYYGAALLDSWKHINKGKRLNVVPSPEGSRVNSSTAKGLRPSPSSATPAEPAGSPE